MLEVTIESRDELGDRAFALTALLKLFLIVPKKFLDRAEGSRLKATARHEYRPQPCFMPCRNAASIRLAIVQNYSILKKHPERAARKFTKIGACSTMKWPDMIA